MPAGVVYLHSFDSYSNKLPVVIKLTQSDCHQFHITGKIGNLHVVVYEYPF